MAEYQVVTSSGYSKFVAEVESLLAAGWECQGGVCVSPDENWHYIQAMVRKLPPKPTAVAADGTLMGKTADGGWRVTGAATGTFSFQPAQVYTGSGEVKWPVAEKRPVPEAKPSPDPAGFHDRITKLEAAVAAHSTALTALNEKVAQLARFQSGVKYALTNLSGG